MLPDDVHWSMFVPNTMSTCSDAQQAHWLPRIEAGEVIGCYAQTELSHGSNVRALRTTATYLRASDEIEIHTPDLEATKWWPGGLGLTANHAMVFARLLVDGKDHGVHNFIVPLRDVATHELLPGVHTGDIGPKIGYNTMDNGFAAFDRVRIPRANMPCRYATLTREGVLERTAGANPRVAYVTMLGIRALLVSSAADYLAKGCTVAVRYSAVRRQGFRDSGDDNGGMSAGGAAEELPVLDYRLQQYRLLPLLCTAFVFKWMGFAMDATMASLRDGIAAGDFSLLQDTHAASSGLKAVCTRLASDGLEECRKACGGHGYLEASGLPELHNTYLANCTLEGDNYMICQQTTRHLLKCLQRAREGAPVGGECAYLGDAAKLAGARCTARYAADFLDLGLQTKAYESRAAAVLLQTEQAVRTAAAAGLEPQAAQNAAMVEIGRSSAAHSMLLLLRSCSHPSLPPRFAAVAGGEALHGLMAKVRSLFALYYMERDLAEFLEHGHLSQAQATLLRQQVRSLLQELRPQAVALVDAWGIADCELNSALGRHDGRVYEALMASAQKEPLNTERPRGGWQQRATAAAAAAAADGARSRL